MSPRSTINHLLLAAALSVGGYVGSEALSPVTGVSLVGQAHAQGWSRIKRIRIKKRRVGSGFKMRAVTTSPSASAILGAAASGATVGGAALVDVSFGDARRGRVNAVNDYTDFDDLVSDVSTVSIRFGAGTVNDDGSVDGSGENVNIPMELTRTATGRLRGEGVGENGWKARLRTDGSGQARAVLLHENKRWAGDGVTDVQIEGPDGAVALEVESVTQTFVAQTDVDLEAAGPLAFETRLQMADGSVVTRTEIVNVAEEQAPEVSKVTARETRNGAAKFVTITQSTGQAAQLAVNITDTETGEVVLATTDDTPVSSVRTFFTSGVEFDDGESPAGYVYLCLVDLIDDSGELTGEQQEVELVVPAYVEGEVNTTIAPFEDGSGQLVMAVDEEGYHLGIGLGGDTGVMGANVIFEEPFEGPAPQNLEYELGFTGQLDKWIQKGDGALPDSYSVSTTLTEDGVVVGGVEGATGSGGGTVHKTSGNGSGTRKAAATTRNIQVALL